MVRLTRKLKGVSWSVSYPNLREVRNWRVRMQPAPTRSENLVIMYVFWRKYKLIFFSSVYLMQHDSDENDNFDFGMRRCGRCSKRNTIDRRMNDQTKRRRHIAPNFLQQSFLTILSKDDIYVTTDVNYLYFAEIVSIKIMNNSDTISNTNESNIRWCYVGKTFYNWCQSEIRI